MTLTLGIAEMVFKLKLIHCYIFKNIIIFLSFRGILGHLNRIIGTLLCYHGNGLMMIFNAILCLNTDEKVFYPHFHTQIQCSDGIFKVLEHLK